MDAKRPMGLFQDLCQLDLDRYEVAVLLASYPKDASKPRFAHLQMGDDLPGTFLGVIGYAREHQLKVEGEVRVHSYRLDSQPVGDVVEYMDLTMNPYTLIREQVDDLDRSVLGTDPFRADALFLQQTRFYAIVLRSKGGSTDPPLCFLRQYQPLMRKIGRSLKVALLNDRGYFNLALPADIFVFDSQVDAIKVGDTLFVLDKQRVHSMFGFFEALRTTVDTSMQRLAQSRIAIDNVGAFAEACRRDPRKAARLRSIAQKFESLPSYQRLDMQRITAFIASRGLNVRMTDGHLMYDAKTLWSTLRLLDDDYLISELTGDFYEVSGKEPFQQ